MHGLDFRGCRAWWQNVHSPAKMLNVINQFLIFAEKWVESTCGPETTTRQYQVDHFDNVEELAQTSWGRHTLSEAASEGSDTEDLRNLFTSVARPTGAAVAASGRADLRRELQDAGMTERSVRTFSSSLRPPESGASPGTNPSAVLDIGEDIVRQYVLHKGKSPKDLRCAGDVAVTNWASYRNIADKAWRWMENMATTEEKAELSALQLSDQAQHNAVSELFSAVHDLLVEYLTEVYEQARLAHNSRKPVDAKVVKPLINLTEVRTKNKVLQVRFLGQNLPIKLKEVGLNSVNLNARSMLQTWRTERATNSQPSQAPAPPTN